MKRLLFAFFTMQAEGITNMTTVPAPAGPTSENLTKLQSELAENFGKTAGLAVGSKTWNDAMLLVYKTQKLIDAEIATINKAANDAKMAEARNKRLALVTDFETAVIANSALQADKKADEAAKMASTENLAKLREALQNEILGSLKIAPAKPAGDKPAGEGKGATTARIRAAFDVNRAAGLSDTENIKAIIAGGESRGTTGAVVLAYQRELGEKS